MMNLLAYIDPGTMSFLIQLILGGAAAAWVVFKMFGRKIMSFLGLAKKTEEKTPPKDEN